MDRLCTSTYYLIAESMESSYIPFKFMSKDKSTSGRPIILSSNKPVTSFLMYGFLLFQASVKFPPKNSIKHILSQISGSEDFLLERFNFMKEYFDSISSIP